MCLALSVAIHALLFPLRRCRSAFFPAGPVKKLRSLQKWEVTLVEAAPMEEPKPAAVKVPPAAAPARTTRITSASIPVAPTPVAPPVPLLLSRLLCQSPLRRQLPQSPRPARHNRTQTNPGHKSSTEIANPTSIRSRRRAIRAAVAARSRNCRAWCPSAACPGKSSQARVAGQRRADPGAAENYRNNPDPSYPNAARRQAQQGAGHAARVS